MRIAMLGTRGVPAQYGGFETAVEEVGQRLVQRGHDVIVYCRNTGQVRTSHLGMELINLPFVHRRSLETITHTGLSVLHASRRRPDAAILFNCGNAPFIPYLRLLHIPTAVHLDGLEWKRAKWAGLGASYYRRAESLAVRSALAIIADAQGIADYVQTTYGRSSYLIPYGAPIIRPDSDRLGALRVSPRGYHLVVARMEPENHVEMIVAGYRQSRSPKPLVVVGSTPYGNRYVQSVQRAAGGTDVRFLGSLWDQELLDQLYAHSSSYLHGHSVGGTNPSLLRALGAGAPVTAYDVTFNREVTAGHALYFRSATSVAAAIQNVDADPESARRRGEAGRSFVAATYRWDAVAEQYERILSLLARGHLASKP